MSKDKKDSKTKKLFGSDTPFKEIEKVHKIRSDQHKIQGNSEFRAFIGRIEHTNRFVPDRHSKNAELSSQSINPNKIKYLKPKRNKITSDVTKDTTVKQYAEKINSRRSIFRQENNVLKQLEKIFDQQNTQIRKLTQKNQELQEKLNRIGHETDSAAQQAMLDLHSSTISKQPVLDHYGNLIAAILGEVSR